MLERKVASTGDRNHNHQVMSPTCSPLSHPAGQHCKGNSQQQLTLYYAFPTFNDLKKKPFENRVGEGENGSNQHCLLFPTMFSTHPKTNFIFSVTFSLLSANAFNLDQSKILLFGTELALSQRTKF